jgi:L-ascorbate metabolism protein UlaG (beta-lactamase superfamily)
VELTLGFRWLGNAGFVWTAGGHTLAHDPFLTRPPLRKVFWGRVEPDRALVTRHLPTCDHILVTCARWDHLMDVPAVAERTGARCYGPARACELLRALGVPEGQIHEVRAGVRLELGPFRVHVLPGEHTPTPLDWLLNGPLPERLESPLHIRDYRMADRADQLSYWIGLEETSWLLARQRAVPATVLAVMPYESTKTLRRLLAEGRPRLVVPYHWDNLFRPLSRPLKPFWMPPRAAFPLLTRVDLDRFARQVAALDPEVKVFVPQVLGEYDLAELVPPHPTPAPPASPVSAAPSPGPSRAARNSRRAAP